LVNQGVESRILSFQQDLLLKGSGKRIRFFARIYPGFCFLVDRMELIEGLVLISLAALVPKKGIVFSFCRLCP